MVIALISGTGIFKKLDRVFWDLMTRSQLILFKPDPSILMVAIDQSSLDEMAKSGQNWPWPKDVWEKLIENAERSNVNGILFDIMFEEDGSSDSAYYLDIQKSSEDYFRRTPERPLPVVISSRLIIDSKLPDTLPESFLWLNSENRGFTIENYGITLPGKLSHNTGIGLSNIVPDNDLILRSTPLFYEQAKQIFPTTMAQTLQQVYNIKSFNNAIDPKGRLWIRYYSRGGPSGDFPYISVSELISGEVDPTIIEGKTLIIGGSASLFQDFKKTPIIDSENTFPGFEIQATVISNILKGDYLIQPKISCYLLFLFTFGALAVILAGIFRKSLNRVITLLVLIFLMFITSYLTHFMGYLVPTATALIAITVGSIVVYISKEKLTK
jgi:adenylate cyclase